MTERELVANQKISNKDSKQDQGKEKIYQFDWLLSSYV